MAPLKCLLPELVFNNHWTTKFWNQLILPIFAIIQSPLSHQFFFPMNRLSIAGLQWIVMRLQKQFQVQEGISCICNDFPWIGVLTDVDPENHDVLAKFLHPYFPSVLFHWHSKMICAGFLIFTLCIISTPTTATGRQYNILQKYQ